jgi:hypothetical protein
MTEFFISWIAFSIAMVVMTAIEDRKLTFLDAFAAIVLGPFTVFLFLTWKAYEKGWDFTLWEGKKVKK